MRAEPVRDEDMPGEAVVVRNAAEGAEVHPGEWDEGEAHPAGLQHRSQNGEPATSRRRARSRKESGNKSKERNAVNAEPTQNR